MTSERRTAASRENAKMGGVKTDEGKAISRTNATKHGVLAAAATAYDPIDLAEAYEAFANEFKPETPSRRVLVEQLALTVVRLARCARAEAEIMREAMNPRVVEKQYPPGCGMRVINPTITVISEGEPATLPSSALEKLALIVERYEPRLVSRYLRLLEALRSAANG